MVKQIGGFPDNFAVVMTVTEGVAIAEGDILAYNGNVVERSTASSTIHSIVGFAAETITTAAKTIKVNLFIQGQLYEVSTKNNTDTTERYEGMILDGYSGVDNTDTTVTGPTAVFTAMAIVGATGDKKWIGEFHRQHPTST